jgi:hypothetical protein
MVYIMTGEVHVASATNSMDIVKTIIPIAAIGIGLYFIYTWLKGGGIKNFGTNNDTVPTYSNLNQAGRSTDGTVRGTDVTHDNQYIPSFYNPFDSLSGTGFPFNASRALEQQEIIYLSQGNLQTRLANMGIQTNISGHDSWTRYATPTGRISAPMPQLGGGQIVEALSGSIENPIIGQISYLNTKSGNMNTGQNATMDWLYTSNDADAVAWRLHNA